MKPLPAVVLGLSATAAAQNQTVRTVTVGQNDKLLFRPSVVYAPLGATVLFEYYPMNHSVVQGTFDSPCLPLDGGFYSGYVPSVEGEAANAFVITITDDNPIYYYCSQGRHCQSGMVGVINPPMNDTGGQLAYAQAAANAPRNVPGSDGVFGGQLISLSGNSSTPANVSATVSSVAPLSTLAANSTAGGASGSGSAAASSTGSLVSAGSPASTTTGSSTPSGTGSAASSSSSPAAAAPKLVASGMLGGLGLIAWLGAGVL